MRLKGFVLLLTLFFILSPIAEAAGVPSQIIVWTDKKVYHPWYITIYSNKAPTAGDIDSSTRHTLRIYVAVLDDDGNLMSGRNIVGYVRDDCRYDHYDKNNASYHHENISTGGIFLNVQPSFSYSNGLYTATVNLDTYLDSNRSVLNDDHLRIEVFVQDQAAGLSAKTYVLASPILICSNSCHGSRTPDKYTAHRYHVDESSSSPTDTCTVCHYGYEHFYENVTDTIPDEYKDVHFFKLNPPDVTYYDRGTTSNDWAKFVWNRTDTSGSGGSLSWAEKSGGGAKFCANCHVDPSTGRVYDWDSSSDIVSCSNCHSETSMEGATPPSIFNSYGTYGVGDYSHAHPGNTSRVSCGLCHGSIHNLRLPNETYTEYYISEQCWKCHDISGGIDIMSNGVTVNHPDFELDCRACHLDNNLTLDAHTVPVAETPSPNCVSCHDIGGKVLVHIDVSAMNSTQNRHYNLNNATDPTANGLRWENRLCWACHGEDDNNDGVMQYSEQPADQHPSNYRSPRMCTDCHNNATYGSLIGAPQVSRHTWYDTEVTTPAVSYCGDCHGLSENILPNSDPEFTYESAAAHYGKFRADLEAIATSPDFCKYCHQNETTPYPFANPDNKVRPEHSNTGTPPDCTNSVCHGSGPMHNPALKVPAVTDSLCQTCHADKQPHNGTIGCVECHMNNTPEMLHPMTFLQPDGSISTSRLTAVSCYDCHKSNRLDSLLLSWGATRLPKVKNQHHSESPINGSKWGDYWSYEPRYLTFTSSYSLSEGSISDFNNLLSVSNNYTTLSESPKGGVSAFKGTFPYNRGFDSGYDGWTIQSQSPATGGYDSSYGNPAGSIYAYIKTRYRNTNTYSTEWQASFYYDKVKPVAYSRFSFDYRVTTYKYLTSLKITAYIEDPDGVRHQVYTVTKSSPDTSWNSVEILISNPNSIFSKKGYYKIILKTEFQLSSYRWTKEGKVYFDNVELQINEEEYQQYDLTLTFEGVPNTQYTLNLEGEYLVSDEPAILQIYDYSTGTWGRSFELNATAWKQFRIQLYSNEYQNGVVRIKIADKDRGIDTIQDYVKFKYILVQSDTGRIYPCQQCHASEKHETPALGSIRAIMANNIINTTDLSNSYWCVQCHWQFASNYTEMVNEYNVSRGLPVPPEITNGTYAPTVASDGTSHYDHTNWINQYGYSDRSCAQCHATYFEDGVTTTTDIIHDVETGSLYTRDYMYAECLNCHSSDVNTSKLGRHQNLDGVPGVSYTDCMACHFKLGGMGLNYTPTVGLNFYDCNSCHTPEGESSLKPSDQTLIITNFSHGQNYCLYCHALQDYHNDYSGPLGTVEAPGWSGWVNGTSVTCVDCHYSRNLDDEPFHAPGISKFKASYSSCSGGNCHGMGEIHSVIPQNPDISPIVGVNLNVSGINPGDSVLVTATARAPGSQISYAYYELTDYEGSVTYTSGDLTPKDGEWGGVDSTKLGNGYEEFEFVINGSVTSQLKAGKFKVKVYVMQDAPKSGEGRYYPRNGAYGMGYAILSVSELGSVAANLDFEALNVSGWFVNWQKVILSGNPTVESSTADYHSSSHSLHIASSASDVCYVQSINISVTPGKTYRVLVWVKGNADHAAISIVQWNGSQMIGESTPIGLIGITSSWLQFGTEFQSVSNSTSVTIRLWVNGSGDVYFDDVKVIEKPSEIGAGLINGGFEETVTYSATDPLSIAEFWQIGTYVNGEDPPVRAWEPYFQGARTNVSKTFEGSQAVEINGEGYWTSPSPFDIIQDESNGCWFQASHNYVSDEGLFITDSNYIMTFAVFSDRMNGYAGANVTVWYYDSSSGTYSGPIQSNYVIGIRQTTQDYVVGVVNVTKPPMGNLFQIKLLSVGNNHVLFDDINVYKI